MNLKQLVILVILSALWGASFIFIKISSPVLGPFFLMDIRILLAGTVLLIYSIIIKNKFDFFLHWKKYLFLGIFNAALPFTLIATAALTLTASLLSILNSTMPIFTAVIAALWLKNKLDVKITTGILLGFTGVIIIVGWNPVSTEPIIFLSAGFSIAAAACYGISSVYLKKNCSEIPTLNILTGQLLGGGLVLLPFALLNIPSEWPQTDIIFSVLALSLICTALALFMYIYLLKSAGPTKAASTLFLVPVFGTTWGIMLLGDTVNLEKLIGLLCVMISIYLITEIKFFGKVKENYKNIKQAFL